MLQRVSDHEVENRGQEAIILFSGFDGKSGVVVSTVDKEHPSHFNKDS